MRIDVTQEDIAQGKRNSGFDCAIALAAKRCGVKRPYVTELTMEQSDGWDWTLPPLAKAFVAAYDAGEATSPFSFEIGPDRP